MPFQSMRAFHVMCLGLNFLCVYSRCRSKWRINESEKKNPIFSWRCLEHVESLGVVLVVLRGRYPAPREGVYQSSPAVWRRGVSGQRYRQPGLQRLPLPELVLHPFPSLYLMAFYSYYSLIRNGLTPCQSIYNQSLAALTLCTIRMRKAEHIQLLNIKKLWNMIG